jgi:hypothetical protein
MPNKLEKRFIAASVGLLLFLGLIIVKDFPTHAGNETTRLDTIQCLAEKGTFAIETSRFPTVDFILKGGHAYSDKPYLLSVAQAGIYWLIMQTGVTFESSVQTAVYLIYFLGGYLFAVGIFLLFYRMVSERLPDASFAWRLGMSWAVVLTTLILSYSVTINNHLPAALVLLWLAYELGRYEESPSMRHAGLAGVAAGLLVNFEYPIGGVFGIAAFLLILLPQKAKPHFKPAAVYSAVALAGLALIPLLNLIAHGSPIPLYSQTHKVAVEGRDYLRYLWEVTFGYKGMFLYTPALLFIFPACRKLADEKHPRGKTILLSAAAVVFVAYLFLTSDAGGWCFGNRFLLPLCPLMFYYIVLYLRDWRKDARHWLFLGTLIWGLAVAVIGATNPWPNTHEGFSVNASWADQQVQNPIAGNFLAVSYEYCPRFPLTQFLIHRVYGEEAAVSYLIYAYFNTYNVPMLNKLGGLYHPPPKPGEKVGPAR